MSNYSSQFTMHGTHVAATVSHVTGRPTSNVRMMLGALALTTAAVLSPASIATPVHAATVSAHHHHKCTRTSSGSCIRGGEYCPQADYGHHGWDAKGRRYTCKGDHTHPHWEK